MKMSKISSSYMLFRLEILCISQDILSLKLYNKHKKCVPDKMYTCYGGPHCCIVDILQQLNRTAIAYTQTNAYETVKPWAGYIFPNLIACTHQR